MPFASVVFWVARRSRSRSRTKPCDGWPVAMLFTVGASRSVKMFFFLEGLGFEGRLCVFFLAFKKEKGPLDFRLYIFFLNGGGEGGEGFVENCKAWLRRGQRCPLGRCHVPKVCWEVVG